MNHVALEERIKDLEKKLYITLKSKEDLNELCEKLLVRYDELKEKYLLYS